MNCLERSKVFVLERNIAEFLRWRCSIIMNNRVSVSVVVPI